MNTYIQSIITTMASCHLLLLAASEWAGENTKKQLRFLCGLLLLLTLFRPIENFGEALDHALNQFFSDTAEEAEQAETESHLITAAEAAYAYIAEEWMSYITKNYAVTREQIQLTFRTDENEDLQAAEIRLIHCPYAIRRQIEKDMAARDGIPVTVRGE